MRWWNCISIPHCVLCLRNGAGNEPAGLRGRDAQKQHSRLTGKWRATDMLTDNLLVNKLLCKDRWFLAWKRFDGTAPSLSGSGDFQVLHPPPERFYADPFVRQTGPTHWIVFEEFLYAKRKGILSAVEIG